MGATAASVSPDGKYVYYFVDETQVGGGRLTLKRVGLDGTERQTILVVDAPLPGTKFRPSHIYPLSTISSDGKRLAISAFLGDGKTAGAPFGLMVFDLEKAAVSLVIHGPTWCNMHPQYCRSPDPEAVPRHPHPGEPRQHVRRHGGHQAAGRRRGGRHPRHPRRRHQLPQHALGPRRQRVLPGAPVLARPQRLGHHQHRHAQAARGPADRRPAPPHTPATWASRPPAACATTSAAASPSRTSTTSPPTSPASGSISDAAPLDKGGRIYLAELGEPGKDAAKNFQYLLSPRSSGKKEAHIHPFLSPDGKLGFFNSDESGILQAYMIRGLAV